MFDVAGDGDNDIEFLQRAGLGIAMRNGTETIKRCAKRTSACSNVECGVAVELLSIFAHLLPSAAALAAE